MPTNLEDDQSAKEAITPEFLQGGASSYSGDELGAAEEADEAEAANDQLGEGYTGDGSEASDAEGKTGLKNRLLSRFKSPADSNSAKKKGILLLLGGGGTVLIVVAIIFLLLFLGALKAVHFSTILRTTGFAASQNVMRQAFNEVAYTDWVVENETVQLPRSKLLDKLRGQDMRKIQKKLAEDGKFKYTKDKAGKVDGFELNSQKVSFDELAQKMGKPTFDQLSYREKLTARKYLTDQIRTEIGDTYNIEVRSYRNGFWKGFREATGIKMTRFRDIFRDQVGNGVVDETKNTDTVRTAEENADIQKGGPVDSSIPAVDDASKGVSADVKANAKVGIRKTAKASLDTYLKGKGTDIIAFEEGMSKASTAVLVTSLYCIGHDMAGTSDRINQEIELSMARFGHQQQTTSDQVKSGDVSSGDASYAGTEWNGDGKTPDAGASTLYMQNVSTATDGSGLDDVPRMNIPSPFTDWLKPLDKALRAGATFGISTLVPPVDKALDSATTKACGVVMNPYAQGGILITDFVVSAITLDTKEFVTKLLTSFAYFAGFAGVGHIIQTYINQLAGAGVTGMEIGADKYNASAVTTDYLNSQTSRGVSYGAPETLDQAAGSKALGMNELRNQYKNSSIKDRYFAISNPTSLLGLAVARIPTSLSSTGLAISSLPKSIYTSFTHVFGTVGLGLFGGKAMAQNTQDVFRSHDYFGVSQWGWTPNELSILASTNLVDNSTEVEAAMDQNPSYYDDLAKCYTSGRLLYELAQDENCSREKLQSYPVLKWRIYKLHEFGVNQEGSEGINETDGYTGGGIGGAAAIVSAATAGPGATSQTPIGAVGGLDCPAGLTDTVSKPPTTYYRLPDAPGVYTKRARAAAQYGQKELVCVINTAAKAYKQKYGDRSTVDVGDLNAAGHKSHNWGVAVDINAKGQIGASNSTAGNYDPQATIDFGMALVNTGLIKNIWWCGRGSSVGGYSSKDGTLEAIRAYGNQVGKPVNIKCLSGHQNHFHVDINIPHGTYWTP